MPSNKEDTALITGASSGIGKELATIHAQKGGHVVLVARSKDKLNKLKDDLEKQYAIKATVIADDLSDPAAPKRIFAATEAQKITVDYLINNAGFGGHGKFGERPWQDEKNMMQVNMLALTELTHLFLRGMVERKYGKILNVSSTASFLPGPLQAVYYATKAYVTSLTQAIAEENKENNITATALCPGFVDTGFASASNLQDLDAFKSAKTPESVAKVGYRAMEKGKLIAINELSLRFLLTCVLPFLPRKTILSMSRKAMEKS